VSSADARDRRDRCAITGIGNPGARYVTALPGRLELAVGMPMVVRFDPLTDVVTLPRRVPA
jgi:hypothetical protein